MEFGFCKNHIIQLGSIWAFFYNVSRSKANVKEIWLLSYMLRLRPLILKLEISIISPRLLPVVDMSSGIFNYASYDGDQDLLIRRKKIAKNCRSMVAKETSDLYR